LRFKTPVGAERMLERWLASRMRKYRYVIVPDYEDENLTGVLSHGMRYIPKEKVKYIGILSRLKKRDVPEDIDYFITLSGPEPQRSVLERHIIAQIEHLEGRIIIAGAKPNGEAKALGGNAEYYSFLDGARQEDVMNRAKFIITRSGYSTVMELTELEKEHMLLLPTPGQTEQEYLADYYEEQGYFHHVSQYRLRLLRDITAARRFRSFRAPWKTTESVRRFMDIIYS
jgi:UDP-N-acetylglucosamine transferase subunit ALG13